VIVLDTTVLVYAVGTSHALREPCRRIVEGVRDQRIDATTTVEVLQEFAHVRARRHSRDDAAELTGEFLELLAPLLVVEEHQLRSGLAIYQNSKRLGAFHSVLAATAIHAGAQALVSADESFAEVGNLQHVFPDVGAVETLEGR
jgi:predicted nucleic acid-binding protein